MFGLEKGKSQINNLSSQHMEKEEQSRLKARRKEMVRIGSETTEIQDRRTIEKVNQWNSALLKDQ